MKWGLIGASNIGREFMINAIRQTGGVINANYSRDKTRAENYANEFGIANPTDNLDDLLGRQDIEAVYIATTNEQHAHQAIAAMKAGKHVLCEKPLTTTLELAMQMIEASEENNVTLGVNHHIRNIPAIRMVKNLLEAGHVGEIKYVRMFKAVQLPDHLQYWRINDPSTGSGVVLDITSHVADTLRFVLDKNPVRVASMGQFGHFGADAIEDGVTSTVEYEGGIIGITNEGFTTKYANTGVEIHGTKGSIIARECTDPTKGGEVSLRYASGETTYKCNPVNPYIIGLNEFEAGTPTADGLDGMWSLAHSLAVLESIKYKRFVEIFKEEI